MTEPDFTSLHQAINGAEGLVNILKSEVEEQRIEIERLKNLLAQQEKEKQEEADRQKGEIQKLNEKLAEEQKLLEQKEAEEKKIEAQAEQQKQEIQKLNEKLEEDQKIIEAQAQQQKQEIQKLNEKLVEGVEQTVPGEQKIVGQKQVETEQQIQQLNGKLVGGAEQKVAGEQKIVGQKQAETEQQIQQLNGKLVEGAEQKVAGEQKIVGQKDQQIQQLNGKLVGGAEQKVAGEQKIVGQKQVETDQQIQQLNGKLVGGAEQKVAGEQKIVGQKQVETDQQIQQLNEKLVVSQNGDVEKQKEEIRLLNETIAKQKKEINRLGDPILRKREILPDDPAFSSAVPFPVAIITSIGASGVSDLLPVKYWGFINGIPKLMFTSLCQRDPAHAPTLMEWLADKPSLEPSDPTKDQRKENFKRRYSSKCVDETQELVINIPVVGQEKKWLDTASHTVFFEPDFDKWSSSGYTKGTSKMVKAPYINECVINIECRVVDKVNLPTHDLFILEPLLIHTADCVKQADGLYAHIFGLEAPTVVRRRE